MDQPYPPQPQFVMMPVPQRNTLGTFGFLVALFGLFIPTGVIALLGLTLSLAAIGRSPRGLAGFGVVLGLLGTVFWLIVMIGALILGLIAALVAGVTVVGGFALTQPEVVQVTSDMVNAGIAVEEYRVENDELPDGLTGLGLGVATRLDPWGASYRLVPIDHDPGFDIVSDGPDGLAGTGDDIRLTGLDRVWEEAIESFEDRMETLGERIERIEGSEYHMHLGDGQLSCDRGGYGTTYERAARAELAAECD